MKRWMKRIMAAGMVIGMLTGLMACSGKDEPKAETESAGSEETKAEAVQNEVSGAEETEIQVFIAASLNTVMTDLAEQYQSEYPEVKITFNADSSGKLLTQIEEGYACDIFFSAAQKQMDQLEADGLVIEGSRHNVVNNQVVVLTLKDSGTKVTGLENLDTAASIALAGGSVPVGKYTRQALVNMGILQEVEDISLITTQEISDALGGVEISEQDNVSKVLIAVTEGACEVGTTYYSDTYGYEDKVEILEKVSYDLTGDVIYPICLVQNKEADETQKKAAEDFLQFVLSDASEDVFENYYFDTNVE
jgi:molybdate transport system substrate-binding protein